MMAGNFLLLVMGFYISFVVALIPSDARLETGIGNTTCSLSVDNVSLEYFQHLMDLAEPNIVYFYLQFDGTIPKNASDAVFPNKWVWTYSSGTRRGMYPYLYWNIDYDIFSFNLLDTKTPRKMPYVKIKATGSCNLTLGSKKTTKQIVEQLKLLVPCMKSEFKQYQTNYWCFRVEAPGIRNTTQFWLGLYFVYPVSVVRYSCCKTYYNFTEKQYVSHCKRKELYPWPQCTVYPYFLGIILFLYCPIFVSGAVAFQPRDEIRNQDEECKTPSNTSDEARPLLGDSNKTIQTITDLDWIYLDGTVPICFTGLIRGLFKGIPPAVSSRLWRFVCVLLAPFAIYLKLVIYEHLQFKDTHELLRRGLPCGFLSLLATSDRDRIRTFVPALGGPVTVAVCFYVFSVMLIVTPKSLKRIIELGLPSNSCEFSILCLSTERIQRLSQSPTRNITGHRNASNFLRCCFYMLFSSLFWKSVFRIQMSRLNNFQSCRKNTLWKGVVFCLLPFYIVFCVVEVLLCVVYFSVPLVNLVTILVRGATCFVIYKMKRGKGIANGILKNRLLIVVISIPLVSAMIFYAYCVCLVFIDSFFFLSEFLIYSYLAVIIYPSVAFGYLFFIVVLVYYIFHLVCSFGHRYLELLNDVVDISLAQVQSDSTITNYDGNLEITNVRITTVKSIRVNGQLFPLSRNMYRCQSDQHYDMRDRVRFENNTYGVPKDLFKYVIGKHLPVHQQVFKLIFRLGLIFILLWMTASFTAGSKTGPTSHISDVMHVIFIIVVGALPRVLEVALSDSSEHIAREIKLRNIEDTMNQYWREKKIYDLDIGE